jgi:hypothetical protein
MPAERLLHEVGLHGPSFSAAQAHEGARGLLACVRRGLCAMRGHDLVFHFEPRRLSLQCLDCGWESTGWMIDRPRFSYTRDRPVRGSHRASSAATFKAACRRSRTRSMADDNTEAAGTDASGQHQRMSLVS